MHPRAHDGADAGAVARAGSAVVRAFCVPDDAVAFTSARARARPDARADASLDDAVAQPRADAAAHERRRRRANDARPHLY